MEKMIAIVGKLFYCLVLISLVVKGEVDGLASFVELMVETAPKE